MAGAALLPPAFVALLKEAQFTREMLATGPTRIRNANYAKKGVYFQAFTSLSTGLERIGKLRLIVDKTIKEGWLPDAEFERFLKCETCPHQSTRRLCISCTSSRTKPSLRIVSFRCCRSSITGLRC